MKNNGYNLGEWFICKCIEGGSGFLDGFSYPIFDSFGNLKIVRADKINGSVRIYDIMKSEEHYLLTDADGRAVAKFIQWQQS